MQIKTNSFLQPCRAGFAVAVFLSAALASRSEMINIAFHNGLTTADAMVPTANPTAPGAVVDTAIHTWNNVVNNGGIGLTFSGFALLNATGWVSGATLQGQSGYAGYNNNSWAGQNKDYVMMEGWYGFRASESLTVSGLPDAFTSNGYTVAVYGDANTVRTMNYTLGGVTQTLSDNGTFTGDFVPYTIVFHGLSNTSFTLTGNPGTGDSRSAVNGIRIVSNPGPPPPPPPGAVGVNFHHGPGGILVPTDAAGVIPMAGWNNVDVGDFGNFTNHPFTDTALQFADGGSSGITLSITLGSGYNGNSGSGVLTSDHVLMSEYISWDPVDGSGPEDPGTIRFSGLGPILTANGYDVLVYFDSDRADRTFTIRIGNATVVGRDAGTFAGRYIRAQDGHEANYAQFRGLTAPDWVLEMDSDTGRAAVNAVQILPRDVMPPLLAIEQFTARPGRIQPGGSAELRWEVTDATRVTISPEIGDVTAWTTNGVGRITVAPAESTLYTLTATHAPSNLTATATARVVVGPPVPNLVLFLVDDMGWQDTSVPFHRDEVGNPVVSALNQRYRTSAMETLAARGMIFTSAYAAPVCTPTRVALMSGKNPARHRVTNWTTPTGSEPGGSNTPDLKPPTDWRRTGITDTEITLPRLLAGAGYRTIHAGKAHFGASGCFGQYPENLGFDVNIGGCEIGHPGSYLGTANFGSGTHHVPGLDAYHGQDIFLTEALTREMQREITQAVSDGTPFFAYMAHYAVHTPWTVDSRFAANYPELSGNALAFATMIEGMDKSLGDILTLLDTLGVAENTLVVFLSDNGGDFVNTPLRNKKGTLYEGGVRVPLIVSWAQPAPANLFQQARPIVSGSVQTHSVLAWDLFPTLLSFAGVAFGHPVDGHDLGGYLHGTPGYQRPQQFAIHFPHHRDNGVASQNPGTIWRDGPWKLIYDYQTRATELYNLAADLQEANNLAASHPERVMAMTRAMARELHRLEALFPEYITNSTPAPPVMPDLPHLDLDGDGLPDLTEDANANGLRDDTETDPDQPDTDADGTPDGAEVRTGTKPLDAASRFAVALAMDAGIPALLSWPGRTGVLYRVENTPGPDPAAWTVLADDVPGVEGQTVFQLPTIHPDETQVFYRVMLK